MWASPVGYDTLAMPWLSRALEPAKVTVMATAKEEMVTSTYVTSNTITMRQNIT